jgi:hypothetical protein
MLNIWMVAENFYFMFTHSTATFVVCTLLLPMAISLYGLLLYLILNGTCLAPSRLTETLQHAKDVVLGRANSYHPHLFTDNSWNVPDTDDDEVNLHMHTPSANGFVAELQEFSLPSLPASGNSSVGSSTSIPNSQPHHHPMLKPTKSDTDI